MPNKIVLACLLMAAFGADGNAQRGSVKMQEATVPRADLCVTEGKIEELPSHRLSVSVPKMRAFLNLNTPQDLEARFAYLGPTGSEVPLGSGAIRRQFGIKLHAQDACNLVYAMWRFDPKSEIVVSVKRNPGQHLSSECGNRGYTNIKPAHTASVAAPAPGQSHTLRAEMDGQEMKVIVDNSLAWEGNTGAEALALHGPVGVRSDNAHLELELRTKRVEGEAPASSACRSGPDEAE